jgi:two-component system sensor histidine kinase KdpD
MAGLRGYAGAILLVAAATLAGLGIAPRWGNSAVDLLYLPPVLAIAVLAGRGPALFAAIGSALAYNYFFTAPYHTFRIQSPDDVLTVVVLFLVAVVVSHLAASIRSQARLAEAHAGRNATIAGLAQRLLSRANEPAIANVATEELAGLFACNAVLFIDRPQLHMIAAAPRDIALTPSDLAAAALVLATGEPTGRGTARPAPIEWQFHPVGAPSQTLATVGLARDDGSAPVAADQLPLLRSLLDQVALALERARLERDARDLAAMRERDHVRSALLSSIGRDLGPPVAEMHDALAALRRGGSGSRSAAAAIAAQVVKIDRYISNLLELEPEADQRPIEIRGVTIDLVQRHVARAGNEVHLTPKEYAVLAELAKHPGRVLSHAHLLRTAWGPAQEGQTEYLRVAVRALRQKLEQRPSEPKLIVNEPGVGYRLVA